MKTRRKKRGRIRLGAILMVVVIILVAFVGVAFLFNVREIKVEGDIERYNTDELIAASGVTKGKSLLLLSEEKISDSICSQFPYVSVVTLKKDYPSTVTLIIRESTECAAMKFEGEYYLLDENCRVLDTIDAASASGYMEIKGFEMTGGARGRTIEVAPEDEMKLKYTQEILSALESAGLLADVESIDVSNVGNITFQYGDRLQVKLGGGDKLDYKMSRLEEIVKELTESDKGTVDLSEEGRAYFIPARSGN
jgi:cell division protein FtsQ